MQKIVKRFLGIMMSALMACAVSTSAFAAESVDSSDSKNTMVQEVNEASADASDRALGKLLATNATTINGGFGTVDVYLPSGNFGANFVAVLGYAPTSGAVSCSVTTPDGDVCYLGTISGSGSQTPSYGIFYASPGTYRFSFSSAFTEPYQVAGFIYD